MNFLLNVKQTLHIEPKIKPLISQEALNQLLELIQNGHPIILILFNTHSDSS